MSLESQYHIPPEFAFILNELIENILINNPKDIEQYCFTHFAQKCPELSQQQVTPSETETGTFYCYFTLRSLPHIHHHYYILAFLSNDPFHVTKTLPIRCTDAMEYLTFTELNKFFIHVDDSILEQFLVLQVYDLDRSKECISELNMDLFHLVRNNTLQWREEWLQSLNSICLDAEEEAPLQPLEVGVKYNWVTISKDKEFAAQALPIVDITRKEDLIEPSVKGKVVVDWEWLQLNDEIQMDVYFVAFVSNSPDMFIKTGLVKSQGKGKFQVNERMKIWSEGPFEEETVIVLQMYKSLGVKELIGEKSIGIKKIIGKKEWVKQQLDIVEENEQGKLKVGEAMVGMVWIQEGGKIEEVKSTN